MLKVLLIYGGQSPEHEISCLSAATIYKAIDKKKYMIDLVYISKSGTWYIQSINLNRSIIDSMKSEQNIFVINKVQEYDVVFPILHGAKGEDGSIQGLFDFFDIKYVGNKVYSSTIAIDKLKTKRHCEYMNIPQVPYAGFTKEQWNTDRERCLLKIRGIGYPIYLKPPTTGSSIGITKVSVEADLDKAVDKALQYGEEFLVEKAVIAREIEIGIIGNNVISLSRTGEVIKNKEFYDYESKYQSSKSRLMIPSQVEKLVEKEIRMCASKIYREMNCQGLARLDFFLDEKGGIFFNEINTFPGFTEKSMFPLLWKETGVSIEMLIDQLIELGME